MVQRESARQCKVPPKFLKMSIGLCQSCYANHADYAFCMVWSHCFTPESHLHAGLCFFCNEKDCKGGRLGDLMESRLGRYTAALFTNKAKVPWQRQRRNPRIGCPDGGHCSCASHHIYSLNLTPAIRLTEFLEKTKKRRGQFCSILHFAVCISTYARLNFEHDETNRSVPASNGKEETSAPATIKL